MRVSNLSVRWWVGAIAWALAWTYPSMSYPRLWLHTFAFVMFVSSFATALGGKYIVITITKKGDPDE